MRAETQHASWKNSERTDRARHTPYASIRRLDEHQGSRHTDRLAALHRIQFGWKASGLREPGERPLRMGGDSRDLSLAIRHPAGEHT